MAEQPDTAELQRLHRWFAVEANNGAWVLAEQVARTAADDAAALDRAHAAAWHWQAVGTPLHHARAALLLGLVHAQLGHQAQARYQLQQARTTITPEVSAPWELALLQVVMAAVAAITPGPEADQARAQAAAAVAALADPDDQAIVAASLATVPG